MGLLRNISSALIDGVAKNFHWLRCAASCALVLLLAGCSSQPEARYGKLELTADTSWSGTVLLDGDVYVPPGVTLTVAPGTVVKFKRIDEKSDQNLFATDSPYYPQAELIVRGRLIAKGTPEKWITFTSAETDSRANDWGAINFLGGEGNVIEYTKIFCAYNGVHAHGSEVVIRHSEFVKNGTAISFKSEEETPGVPWYGKRSHLTITHNLVTRNKAGIGFRNSDATISQNEITDNKFFGLFPKEDLNVTVDHNTVTGNQKGIYLFQAKGVRFEYNNIHDNTAYDISPAEAQDFDVEARNNWFGTTDRAKIEEHIFDRKDDKELGQVLFEPFLTEPVKLEKRS